MNITEERGTRIMQLAERLISAGEALDREDFEEVRVQALEASREARALTLLEKERKESK